MKVLLTGGAGFIGSNLTRSMVLAGHNVLVIDKLTYAGNLSSIKDLIDAEKIDFSQLDLADASAIDDAMLQFAPNAVMHLAAESHVDRSIDGPGEFIQSNIVGTFNLLQASLKYTHTLSAASAKAFRFLHVSTDEVYGSLGETGAFTELTRYSPHSPYSATKAASDHLARAWHDTYGLPVVVTNCSNNYGPYQFPEKLIPVVILKALRREPIPIYGDGLNVRDWLHVEDHCAALKTALCHGTPGETYNIGGNNEMQNIELVSQICDLLDELQPNVDGRSYANLITFVADRPGHDRRYAIDSSKIQSELGWRPQHDRQSGLRQTVRWYLDNQAWWQSVLDQSYQLQRLGKAQAVAAN